MTLVDTNVIIDILAADADWQFWSSDAMQRELQRGPLVINEVVYAELAGRYATQQALDEVVDRLGLQFEWLPKSALHGAGQTFNAYRHAGGTRTSILADFFIGAHAVVAQAPILTRDTKRYRTHFPGVALISPD